MLPFTVCRPRTAETSNDSVYKTIVTAHLSYKSLDTCATVNNSCSSRNQHANPLRYEKWGGGSYADGYSVAPTSGGEEDAIGLECLDRQTDIRL